jgi:hypothetical protein
VHSSSGVDVARRLRAELLLILIGLACERTAFAQSIGASASVPSATRPHAASLWQPEWPEFSTSEGIFTAAAAVGTGVIVFIGPSKHPRWEGGILFDQAVRDEFRGRDAQTRSRFRTVGNYTYRLSPVIPVIDVLLVSALGHGDGKLAINLGLVTLEAFSYMGFSAFASTETFARASRQPVSKARLQRRHSIVL